MQQPEIEKQNRLFCLQDTSSSWQSLPLSHVSPSGLPVTLASTAISIAVLRRYSVSALVSLVSVEPVDTPI